MYIIGLYGQPTDHFHFKLSGCFLIFFYIFLRVDVLGHLFLVIILVTPGTHPALIFERTLLSELTNKWLYLKLLSKAILKISLFLVA
jgi:hypothetical protein